SQVLLDLSPRLAPSSASTPPGGGLSATWSPIAMGPLAAVRAPDTPAREPPSRASWWCRAPPAHTAHRARAARDETGCGALAHHRLSPSRGAPDPPTRRASPSTAPGACDSTPPTGRGIAGVVARPVPTPQAGTSGSRVRHDRDERRTP